MAHSNEDYYVPHGSSWPIIGTVGLISLTAGAANMMNGNGIGSTLMIGGTVITLIMLFGWFGTVIKENEKGMYNEQVSLSFRQGMAWFIFSEVMFFAAFFGTLFYARVLSGPWLGGEDLATHETLWAGFQYMWPTDGPAGLGGDYQAMPAWGLPAINTLILLTSGATVTWAHHALKAGHRGQLTLGLFLTVALGFIFVGLQAWEYIHAYEELNLKLSTGIYGSTFFMLTGFHGLHVTLGAIILLVVWFRVLKGHFTAERHFAFEAGAWYWHFVDVVWLGLFIFVYWL